MNNYNAILAQVKKEVGTQCTYLAFTEEKGQYFLQANLINASGAKDRVTVAIDGTPASLGDKEYNELIEILKTRSYATS